MGRQDEELAVRKSLKVFVGGLPEGCNDRELGRHFDRYGQVTQCNVISPKDSDGKKAPYAFVTYKFAADADCAVVDVQNFPGSSRPLAMGFAQPKKKAAQEEQRKRDLLGDGDSRVVFVGGIGDRDDEVEVGDFFSQWGLVALVFRDSAGWSLVHYATTEGAVRLLEESSVIYQRRRLEIRASDKRSRMSDHEKEDLTRRAITRHFHKKTQPPPMPHGYPPHGMPPPHGHPGYPPHPGAHPPPHYPPPGAPGYPPPAGHYAGAPPPHGHPGAPPPGHPPPSYPPPGAYGTEPPPGQYGGAPPSHPPPSSAPPPAGAAYYGAAGHPAPGGGAPPPSSAPPAIEAGRPPADYRPQDPGYPPRQGTDPYARSADPYARSSPGPPPGTDPYAPRHDAPPPARPVDPYGAPPPGPPGQAPDARGPPPVGAPPPGGYYREGTDPYARGPDPYANGVPPPREDYGQRPPEDYYRQGAPLGPPPGYPTDPYAPRPDDPYYRSTAPPPQGAYASQAGPPPGDPYGRAPPPGDAPPGAYARDARYRPY
eukprot:TRINITY_DN17933_c0_g1_i1.p1 TRINITY_DN17933_c0_g1~~TRINITY_DN17933_c0_g1_i1.p1  ORF type:complete len:538 (+),score=59.18 TRINITY_DN17933_c0_g1_i1:111-1724(+)